MNITMLGTGNAMVTECYNTCFVIRDGKKHFMVDAGGGNAIFRQLKRAGIDWRDIGDIFVTHKHVDHIMGIVWMIRIVGQSISRGNYDGQVRIYGHDEVIDILKVISEMLLPKKIIALFGDKIHLIEVTDGQELAVIGHKVTFFDIQSTKAKQFGFTIDMGEGKKLTCCGDEPYNPCEEKYARGSTWLLHEAFCLYSEADRFKPYEKHHSTVKDAAQLADELGVENLILYHTEDKNICNRKELYSEEGRGCFKGNLLVPEDLETIEL